MSNSNATSGGTEDDGKAPTELPSDKRADDKEDHPAGKSVRKAGPAKGNKKRREQNAEGRPAAKDVQRGDELTWMDRQWAVVHTAKIKSEVLIDIQDEDGRVCGGVFPANDPMPVPVTRMDSA